MSAQSITTRTILAGGTVTIAPSRLMAVSKGKVTDRWGRKFDAPPGGVADFGEGTAPFIDGVVTASVDSTVHFRF